MHKFNQLLADAIVAATILFICIAAPNQIEMNDGARFQDSDSRNKASEIITITEYLEGGRQDGMSDPSRMIDLTGFWDVKNKSTLMVSFAADEDLPFREQILNNSKHTLFDGRTDVEQDPWSWHGFLFNLSESSEMKYPQILAKSEYANGSSSERGDIHIILSGQAHPRFNGQATVTMSNGYIESTEIIIFSADKSYSEGTLAHILEHEVGHALGLSHSNDMQSIMYPKLVIANSSVLGSIAHCERSGLSSLYEESKVEVVSCS